MTPIDPLSPGDLSSLLRAPFGAIVDVRSPAEFAEDHVPGAINLPALSNEERAEIGTIYVQESRFRARRLGAAYVSRNVAASLEGALREMPADWRPLVYCWRGGQRSGSVATIYGQIGWRVSVLRGGYRAYRRLVTDMVRKALLPHRFLLIDGNTGTGKTALLARLAARGHQVLDLEALAVHRGSLFGGRAEAQPSQKAFEGRLAAALSRLSPSRPVVVEAESNRIGALLLPPSVWAAMQDAPRIEVDAPLAARAVYLSKAYDDLLVDRSALIATLQHLRPYHSGQDLVAWEDMARAGQFEALAQALMQAHYDPRYAKARLRGSARVLAQVQAATLDAAGLDRLADIVAAEIDSAALTLSE